MALPCAARQGEFRRSSAGTGQASQLQVLYEVVTLNVFFRVLRCADIVQNDAEENIIHTEAGRHFNLECAESFRQIS